MAIWLSRTDLLSTFSTSISAWSVTWNLLTPTMVWGRESMRAWVRAAASSMRILGMPAAIALAMPPSSSTSAICACALRISS